MRRVLSMAVPGLIIVLLIVGVSAIATGYLHIRGVAHAVTASSWMDHEFGTSQLGPTQVGWDLMCLQLDNRSELMVHLLRHEDGRIDVNSSATLVHPDARVEHLRKDQLEVVASGQWTNPRSGVVYPQGWECERR
jgi:predicted secreted hydrolase